MGSSGVRLTELLVALSLGTDLGLGQPAEYMLRAARISMRIGVRLGLGPEDLATLYDVSILMYVGCPVYGNEAAALFGDDIAFRAGALEVDLAGRPGVSYMLRQVGAGTSAANRARGALRLVTSGGRDVVEQMANHCSAAGELADRLGLDAAVCDGVQQSYARWDGKGVPSHLAGDALALSARISHVAVACEALHRTAGLDAVVDMIRSRTRTHFDPAIAAAVQADPASLFVGLDEDTIDEVLDAEPVERPLLTDGELDQALEAIGDFCDLRCPYFAGHSRGTAALVMTAAESLHLPSDEAVLARRAALVHDIGRIGVPGSVWDKPGSLTAHDRERMRMHPYYAERIFSRPEPLRQIGLVAGAHHERLDTSGYHRGIGGAMLSTASRVLAAADAYHAMTQPRPHRPALTPKDAARELRREADQGLLDHTATEAVLGAAGHATPRLRAGGPAGLTAREQDVLALLARGLPNKGIARHLSISPKTVGNHVERIYMKLGVTNRAAAAMRAMEYHIVG